MILVSVVVIVCLDFSKIGRWKLSVWIKWLENRNNGSKKTKDGKYVLINLSIP